jgi:hypothetical protein
VLGGWALLHFAPPSLLVASHASISDFRHAVTRGKGLIGLGSAPSRKLRHIVVRDTPSSLASSRAR